VSFAVGPRHDGIGPIDYPDSYKSPVRFIKYERTAIKDPAAPDDPSKVEWYCFTCSFRPWADTGDARSAHVTFPGGRRVRAARAGDRWRTRAALDPGESAYVAHGDVRDAYGDFNGEPSARVTR
jgi:hypothetical protein